MYVGLLAIAFLGITGAVTPAAAQCDPSECTNPNGAKAQQRYKHVVKIKHAKKPKRHAKKHRLKEPPYCYPTICSNPRSRESASKPRREEFMRY